MKNFFKYHFLFYFFCLAIFIESSFPSDDYPDLKFEFADKFVHMGIYFVLFLTAYFSFSNQSKFLYLQRNPLLVAFLIVSVYGASDEIHQYFVPGRSCDIFDWIADVIGTALGIVAILFIKKLLNKKKIKSLYDTN